MRARRSGQGWSGWSNVQSVNVAKVLAEIWVNNETADNATVEIVGVETRTFPAGEHYWRTISPGNYTVKYWLSCGSGEQTIAFEAQKYVLHLQCVNASTPQSRESESEPYPSLKTEDWQS